MDKNKERYNKNILTLIFNLQFSIFNYRRKLKLSTNKKLLQVVLFLIFNFALRLF